MFAITNYVKNLLMHYRRLNFVKQNVSYFAAPTVLLYLIVVFDTIEKGSCVYR